MKLSDYIANFIANLGIERMYTVCGGGAMHLNDSLCNHPGYRPIAMHHEQGAAMAAEAETRVNGRIGVIHVTAGPGGTNTATGVASAWVDSIPMLVIAGQVTSTTTIGGRNIRQLGTNELDLVSIMTPITKYAVMITEPNMIRYHLEKAVYLATTGRPGPVWIEVPLDIQTAQIDENALPGFQPFGTAIVGRGEDYVARQVARCLKLLAGAKRPLIIAGNGIRLANAVPQIRELVERMGIPVVSSWTASDMFDTAHPLYVGRPGIFGDRPGNFAVQNADVLFAIGSRLSVPQIGHNPKLFAPNAKQIIVDIDENEIFKPTLRPDVPVAADAKTFLDTLLAGLDGFNLPDYSPWATRCRDWKQRYPVMQEEYRTAEDGVNSYFFVDVLSDKLADDGIVVTDVGSSFIPTMQMLRLKYGQRLIHSCGVSSMGWGFPGSIGATFSSGKQTICLSGDGGMMMNIQELQTVVHHKLPLIIFVFANNGYMTMRQTQMNYFGRLSVSNPESGLSVPDFVAVAKGFGIEGMHIHSNQELIDNMDAILAHKGPFLCELRLPEMHPIIPRVQTKRDEAGNFLPTPIEDLFPFLPRDELAANMND